jgi:hypothetical protein
MQRISLPLLALLAAFSLTAQASQQWATQFAKGYEAQAQTSNPKFVATEKAGREFYTKKVVVDGKDLACAACHTDNPAITGKHNVTGKAIQPLAPSANPNRFTSDRVKSEVGISKHCKDLYGKDCSVQDKANFLTYISTAK